MSELPKFDCILRRGDVVAFVMKRNYVPIHQMSRSLINDNKQDKKKYKEIALLNTVCPQQRRQAAPRFSERRIFNLPSISRAENSFVRKSEIYVYK